MSGSTSIMNGHGMFGLDAGHHTEQADEAGVAVDGCGVCEEQQAGRSQAELNRQNARKQIVEGDLARARLHGIYLGWFPSTLVSRLTGAQTRKDWAESAVRSYSNAISLDPSLAEAYVGRASAYRFLERYGEAKHDLEHARSLGVVDAMEVETELEHRLRQRRIAVAAVLAVVCAASYFAVAYRVRAPSLPQPTQSTALRAPAEIAPPAPPASPAVPAGPVLAPPASAVKPSAAPVQPAALATDNARAVQPLPPRSPAPSSTSMPAQVHESAPPHERVSIEPDAPAQVCGGRAASDGSCIPAEAAASLAATAPATPPPARLEPQIREEPCEGCASVPDQAEDTASVPALAGVSREDARMIELACRSSTAAGAESHRGCIAAQIARLEEALPMPDLSQLSTIDRQLIQRACAKTGQDGPAAYRSCVGSQLIGLASAPDVPDMSALPAERKHAIEAACRENATGAAAYHICLDRQAKPSASRGHN